MIESNDIKREEEEETGKSRADNLEIVVQMLNNHPLITADRCG